MSDTSVDHIELRPALRRMRETLIGGVLYAVSFAGAIWLIKTLAPPQWLAALIALVPILPAMLMLHAELRYWREIDEMKRRMYGEAVLIAAGALIFIALAYGALEMMAGFPHLSLFWVFPIFCLLQCVANMIVYLRYR